MPVPIMCIDALVRQFAARFGGRLSKPQLKHLETVLLGLIMTEERRTLSALVRQVAGGSSLSGLSRFLSTAPWSSEGLAAQWVTEFRCRMAPLVQAEHVRRRRNRPKRRGRPKATVVTGYLIGDDTAMAKQRGKKMAGLGWHYSSTEQGLVWGHSMVLGLYTLLGQRCPLAPRLYRQRAVCQPEQVPFASKIDLMIDAITSFEPVADTRTHVLLDSWYGCKAVWRAARSQGYLITTGLKRNRSLRVVDPASATGWRWCSLDAYAAGLSVGAWRRVRWPRQYGRHERTVWVHVVPTRIRKLYQCQLILIRSDLVGPTSDIRFWASSDLAADPDSLVAHIAARWDVEVLFEDVKELLGLDHYQLLDAVAIIRFWTLVLAAYRLLDEHRLRLQPSCAEPLSIGHARRDLQHRHRRHLLRWCHDQFLAGHSVDHVAALLAA